MNCQLCHQSCPVDAVLPPYQNKVEEERTKSVWRVLRYVVVVPCLMLLGVFLMRLSAPRLSVANKEVRLYQLVMQYAGTLCPPSINDRMIYSGEVGEWLGLRFINLNLLQEATAPLEYNNYAWEKKVVNGNDMEKVAYILYDPEAFSVLINFSRSRMIESPDFMGQYVQTVLNSGFRVTDDKSIFIRQHTKKEGVRRF